MSVLRFRVAEDFRFPGASKTHYRYYTTPALLDLALGEGSGLLR